MHLAKCTIASSTFISARCDVHHASRGHAARHVPASRVASLTAARRRTISATPTREWGKFLQHLSARRPGATARATRAFSKRSRLFRTPGRRCLFQQPALRISAPRTILLALPSLPACRSKCTALVARTSFRRTSVIATQLEDFCMSRLGMVHPLYFALWRSTARCGARGRIS